MMDENPVMLAGLIEKGSSVKELIDQYKWEQSAIGERNSWPDPLKTSFKICLDSPFPVLVLWGKDFLQLYNDAYCELIGKKHPLEFGTNAKEAWQQNTWMEVEPLLQNVLEGNSILLDNHKFLSTKNGYPVARIYKVSYSPIYHKDKVEGIFITIQDKTNQHENQHALSAKQTEGTLFHAPIAMCVLRGSSMIVEAANEKILQLWDKSAEEVLHKPVFEGVPDARNQGYEELLNKVFYMGETIVLDETPLSLNRNGNRENLYLKLMYEPLREYDGTISGVTVLADDITEQVESRKKIEEAEVRLKLAIEAAAIGTFDWDVVNAHFHYSERLAEIFGYKQTTDLTQESFSERIHPEDRAMRMEAHKKAFETGKLFYEARVIWPDNSIHWVRLNGKVIFNDSGAPLRMYGTTLDVTDQKNQAERLEKLAAERTYKLRLQNEALRKSEERYHKMVEEVQDYAIILLDENGIIENWNLGAERIKGYTEKEITGKHFSIFYTQEDVAKNLPGTLLNYAREHGRATHEGYRVKKDGSKFWGSITITALHDDNNHVIGFSKVTRDLTERKIAEEQTQQFMDAIKQRNTELKQSEERYHKMISEVQDYAIILLDRDGIIQNWNVGAENIKGYKASEILGKSFEIFYTEGDQANRLPAQLLTIARTQGKATHEGWRVRKDGSRFWGSIVITALHSNRGEIIGFSKVTRDLTERKMAEDKLREYASELESQNRDLEQFAYIASHDLQEPLRKIQTFTELLQRQIPGNENTKQYFQKISNSAQRMSDLIKAVLNYSKLSKEVERLAMVDLNVIIENVKSDYEVLIQEKHAIIEHDHLPVVDGIALQLNQLFANLIANSLKFNSQEPVIRITTKIIRRSETDNGDENLTSDQYHQINFTDNGIGFELKYAKQIFNMFQRLHGKQVYAGTGIGLALCKKIAENHGGFITAVSEPGKGATFSVYLPVSLPVNTIKV
jgi:PAS domain S-box-containing protein